MSPSLGRQGCEAEQDSSTSAQWDWNVGAGVTRTLPVAMGPAKAQVPAGLVFASALWDQVSVCRMDQPCPSGAAGPGWGRTLPVTAVPGLLVITKREQVPARARVEPVWDGGSQSVMEEKMALAKNLPPQTSQSWEQLLLCPGEEAALPLAHGGNVAQRNPFTATVWTPLGMGREGWCSSTPCVLPLG